MIQKENDKKTNGGKKVRGGRDTDTVVLVNTGAVQFGNAGGWGKGGRI